MPSNPGMTRRDLLKRGFLFGTAAITLSRRSEAAEAAGPSGDIPLPTKDFAVGFTLNGQAVNPDISGRSTLLDVLRKTLAAPGTKKGCDHGQCGACTVLVEGRRVLSCLTLAATLEGKQITTIEGLAEGETLHPMQEAFIAHDAFQCGFCTPGQIMSAIGFAHEPWPQGSAAVREGMSGNLCRCGAYCGIVAAVTQARKASAALPV